MQPHKPVIAGKAGHGTLEALYGETNEPGG